MVAVGIWVLYARTRFGFEAQVIGDSPRAARYAGMRTRRKIVAIMCLSGRDRRDRRREPGRATSATCSTPRGLQQSGYGYTGIVVAALARYNPFAVVLVAFLLGGLQNAGYTLQGADFPSGLVGVMQGMILFAMLGGELLVQLSRHDRRAAAATRTPLRGARREHEHRRRRRWRPRSRTGRRFSSRRSASCSPSAPACSTSASRG